MIDPAATVDALKWLAENVLVNGKHTFRQGVGQGQASCKNTLSGWDVHDGFRSCC
jgi:hypothetical protein